MSTFKHVVAVASGKGGVGKSTVTSGLGLAAVEAGASAYKEKEASSFF